MNTNETTKAVIISNKILCGKCGHKIGEFKGVMSKEGSNKIYIKCKHRDNGQNCNSINEITVN